MQIPGPTNVPDRVLRAMDCAVVDHRGPELPEVTREVVANLRRVFGTEEGRVAVWAGSGSGAWEAAIVNTLNPGDRVLVEMRWGDGVSPELVEVLATFGGVEPALDMAGERVELGSGVTAAQKWFQEDGW